MKLSESTERITKCAYYELLKLNLQRYRPSRATLIRSRLSNAILFLFCRYPSKGDIRWIRKVMDGMFGIPAIVLMVSSARKWTCSEVLAVDMLRQRENSY